MDSTSLTPANGHSAVNTDGQSLNVAKAMDKQLLAAVAKGDEGSFAEIYQRHGTAMFNYLLRLIHDETLAEDLLQETFVAIWQGASTFKRESKVKTWMFRIAHNKAVSWLRRNRPESMGEDPEVRDDGPDPETVVAIIWRNQELLEALNSLSPNHRAAIELVFVHEMAYADIARVMDCPVGTVKSRISYALRHLYRLLNDTDVR